MKKPTIVYQDTAVGGFDMRRMKNIALYRVRKNILATIVALGILCFGHHHPHHHYL